MTTPEGREKAKVKMFLTMLDAEHFWPVQSGYGAPELDCVGSYLGHAFKIEVKRKHYVPSDFTRRQLVIIERTRKRGTPVFTGDAEEIVRQMRSWAETLK